MNTILDPKRNEGLVLVTQAFFGEFGFLREPLRSLGPVFSVASWMPRSEAETSTEYKQIIPYMVLYNSETELIASYVRKGGGEARLEDKVSVGFGGHVEWLKDRHTDDPTEPWLAFRRGMHREREEEIGKVIGPVREELWGLLNTNESPVDDVHLGVVYLYDMADAGMIGGKEAEIKWAVPEFLLDSGDLELWSRLCVKELVRMEKKGTSDA